MAISINGSTNVITGLAAGGLPDGCILDADINGMAASKLSGALPAISGASLTNLPAGGKLLQVVNSTTTTDYTHSSATYGDVGLSASITPQTNSKVLVLLSLQYFIENYKNEGFGVKILRDSTAVFTSSQVYHIYGFSNASGTNVETKSKASFHILDSSVGGDGSSSLTYKVQVGTYQGNGVKFCSNGASSELTLFEVGA